MLCATAGSCFVCPIEKDPAQQNSAAFATTALGSRSYNSSGCSLCCQAPSAGVRTIVAAILREATSSAGRFRPRREIATRQILWFVR